MAKTRKVMNIECNGAWLTCIRHEDAPHNKYYLYTNWWNRGEHRKLLGKYANFQSVLLACASVSLFTSED